MNVALLLEMAAEGAPERVLVGPRRTGLTAADLLARSRRAAQQFRSMGARRVGVVDLNSEAVPVALFGAAVAGIPFAPVNYRLADQQLRALVARLAPGAVVVGPDVAPRLRGVDGVEVVERSAFLDATKTPLDDAELPFVDPDDVAVLLFTSGTTGDPKAAVLRHRHLASYVLTTVECLGAGDDEAQLVSVPPYHVAGLASVLTSMYAGRRIVYLPSFDAETWVATAQAEAVTQAMVVPTMLRRIVDVLEAHGAALPSLRLLSYGGGRAPLELVERAMKVLPHVDFVNAYGLTETSSTISVLAPEDHRTAFASTDDRERKRLGSVGRPLPTVEVEIRDPDGHVVALGERGEIHVRGEQVAGEYLGRSVLVEGGWFPTNDAGYLDDEGFLYLDGRLDDVIVRGGENLSPGEIEETLLAHPAVSEAAVVGVPDPEWGEGVGAVVVLVPGATATAAELRTWVGERLRSTRAPQVVEFRDALPYTETGKLLRRVLRDELRDAPHDAPRSAPRSAPRDTGATA
ncbi:MAG: AMP-binding protein [Acidimicrobiia bacterium]|nr:AMP-binding protein [Acidimicrobiia bacterium]